MMGNIGLLKRLTEKGKGRLLMNTDSSLVRALLSYSLTCDRSTVSDSTSTRNMFGFLEQHFFDSPPDLICTQHLGQSTLNDNVFN